MIKVMHSKVHGYIAGIFTDDTDPKKNFWDSGPLSTGAWCGSRDEAIKSAEKSRAKTQRKLVKASVMLRERFEQAVAINEEQMKTLDNASDSVIAGVLE